MPAPELQPGLILVTGSSGRIGRAVVAELFARGHSIRGYDQVATPGVADCVVGSLVDVAEVRRAMANVSTLIHLAATPDDADVAGELIPNNITGLFHIMEAAREACVRRVILASSGQMNDAQQATGPFPVRAADPVTPRYWYAATKAFMESIGYSFSRRHDMSVIVARLGWCPRSVEQVREIAAVERFKDVYLSPGDAGRFFACAVNAPVSARFEIVYATSRPPKSERLEIGPARERLGFVPEDQWPQGLEIILGRAPQAGEI